ncbi:hypothetical protein A2U01_0094517, partial [Trifolium medium]|nr:hypothetical protein [Trifolium medium]
PARAAPTPETKSETQGNPARRASPSCAPCQGPKLNRLSQPERRVAPDASACRAKGRT